LPATKPFCDLARAQGSAWGGNFAHLGLLQWGLHLIGAIAWILPNAGGSEFWVIALITYVIAIGGFSHVVAGATESWLLCFVGEASLAWALGGFVLPALVGNIIGGTGLFAMLAHAQVRAEI
jgi:formate/nitrite transporter FocA (FNT family)